MSKKLRPADLLGFEKLTNDEKELLENIILAVQDRLASVIEDVEKATRSDSLPVEVVCAAIHVGILIPLIQLRTTMEITEEEIDKDGEVAHAMIRASCKKLFNQPVIPLNVAKILKGSTKDDS